MSKLIGGHRTAVNPGGMIGISGPAPAKRRENWKGVVHRAATEYLAKRGFHNHVNGFEAAAYNYPRAIR